MNEPDDSAFYILITLSRNVRDSFPSYGSPVETTNWKKEKKSSGSYFLEAFTSEAVHDAKDDIPYTMLFVSFLSLP